MKIQRGDITEYAGDAIVNAANSGLQGGGGVDGAIHRAAGPELLEACREIGGCDTGDAVITPGFNLSARHVIHAVGPVWKGGDQNEAALLESCYRRSIELAKAHELNDIAFPAISCGVYGYPLDQAAKVATDVLADASESDPAIDIVMICFSDEVEQAFKQALERKGEAD